MKIYRSQFLIPVLEYDMQKLIFEPFRQVETEISLTYGGNGLGLPIVKAYIELLRGHISLKSEINKGTAFHFTLPLIEKTDQTIIKREAKHLLSVNTVLIAEDEYSNYQYLKEIFDEINLKTLYVENGQEALDLCKVDETIDLVLMDIKMPIMDGHQAALLIKEFRPNLLIIAQTAFALEVEKVNYLNDFDDYITKPINGEELKQKLLKYINHI
jgi:CheY-like chemotaxis protein